MPSKPCTKCAKKFRFKFVRTNLSKARARSDGARGAEGDEGSSNARLSSQRTRALTEDQLADARNLFLAELAGINPHRVGTDRHPGFHGWPV